MSEVTEYAAKQINEISTDTLRNFVTKALEQYGTILKIKEACKVIQIMHKYYEKKKLIVPNSRSVFIDIMDSAALIHNLFLDEGSWKSVFTAREKLFSVAYKEEVRLENAEHIFSIIEGQLGADMPVPSIRPNPNTPAEDFALCCWIAKELKFDG